MIQRKCQGALSVYFLPFVLNVDDRRTPELASIHSDQYRTDLLFICYLQSDVDKDQNVKANCHLDITISCKIIHVTAKEPMDLRQFSGKYIVNSRFNYCLETSRVGRCSVWCFAQRIFLLGDLGLYIKMSHYSCRILSICRHHFQ